MNAPSSQAFFRSETHTLSRGFPLEILLSCSKYGEDSSPRFATNYPSFRYPEIITQKTGVATRLWSALFSVNISGGKCCSGKLTDHSASRRTRALRKALFSRRKETKRAKTRKNSTLRKRLTSTESRRNLHNECHCYCALEKPENASPATAFIRERRPCSAVIIQCSLFTVYS